MSQNILIFYRDLLVSKILPIWVHINDLFSQVRIEERDG